MRRVIYSLDFRLDPPDGKGSVQLIVPLDRNGQGINTRALLPKRRVIDLRAGDWLRNHENVYRILSVKAYRDAYFDGEPGTPDGYVVKGPRSAS